MSKIVRVNMNKLSSKWENVPKKYVHLGGRGITSAIVANEVDPLAEPLGPKNKSTDPSLFVTNSSEREERSARLVSF